MTQHRQRLEAIRRQIEALEDDLARLKAEERRRICELQDLAVKTTPINRIPGDILREIFLQTLPSARETSLSVYPKPFKTWEAPLLLRRICRNWREIADNYSLLWTKLRVYIPEVDYSPPEATLTALTLWINAWLRLSKGSGLEFHLIIHAHKRSFLTRALPPSSYQRLTKLILAGAGVGCLDLLLQLNPDSGFSVLEDLILGFSRENLDWKSTGPIEVFKHCSRLRRVALGKVTTREELPIIILPWQQLTHVIIQSDPSIHFYDNIMKECPLLSFLFISPQRDPEHFDHRSPVEQWAWPSLSSLTINLSFSAVASGVEDPLFPVHLRYLRLEKLQSLRLVGLEFDVQFGEYEAYFTECLQGMKSLQQLSLCFSGVAAKSYIDTFSLLPQLTALDIQLPYLSDRKDDPLRILIDNPTILPNLRQLTLDLGIRWARELSVSNLAELIERCQYSGRVALRQLVIYFPSGSRDTEAAFTLNVMRRLKDTHHGVYLDIRYVEEERRYLEDTSYWVDRDETLVHDWPEARNAFLTSELA